jgi:hypothetical protein
MPLVLVGNAMVYAPVVLTGAPISAAVPKSISPVVPYSPTTLNPALVATMTTNQASYTSGQTVNMTFTATNSSESPVTVTLGPSIDGFSIKNGSKIVWSSNSGLQNDYVTVETLAPGQSLTLTSSWVASRLAGAYTAYNQLDSSVTASFSVSGS